MGLLHNPYSPFCWVLYPLTNKNKTIADRTSDTNVIQNEVLTDFFSLLFSAFSLSFSSLNAFLSMSLSLAAIESLYSSSVLHALSHLGVLMVSTISSHFFILNSIALSVTGVAQIFFINTSCILCISLWSILNIKR